MEPVERIGSLTNNNFLDSGFKVKSAGREIFHIPNES